MNRTNQRDRERKGTEVVRNEQTQRMECQNGDGPRPSGTHLVVWPERIVKKRHPVRSHRLNRLVAVPVELLEYLDGNVKPWLVYFGTKKQHGSELVRVVVGNESELWEAIKASCGRE